MAANKTDILKFIRKLEATRENLVDELLYESRIQHDRKQEDRDSTVLDEIVASLADTQTALVALREEADRRS